MENKRLFLLDKYSFTNIFFKNYLIFQDWEVIEKIWPALCLAESPDPSKQSIVALFDYVQDLIITNHTSFQIEFKVS